MSLTAIPRPSASEHPDYVGYVLRSFLEPDALPALESQPGELQRLLGPLPDELGLRRYAPGKWTLKEVLGHLLDQERVFADRLLRFARGEQGPLPTFDHEGFAANSGAQDRSLAGLLEEFEHLRRANVLMIRALPPACLDLRGRVGDSAFTVRALAYLMAAHVEHHRKAIRQQYLAEKK